MADEGQTLIEYQVGALAGRIDSRLVTAAAQRCVDRTAAAHLPALFMIAHSKVVENPDEIAARINELAQLLLAQVKHDLQRHLPAELLFTTTSQKETRTP